MQMEEMRENARQNSVNDRRERALRKKVRKLEDFRRKAIAVIVLLATATTIKFGADAVDYLSSTRAVHEYFSEVSLRTSREGHPAANHVDTYYDVGDLIEYIKEEPDEIPERMYGVMRHIGFGVSWTTDEFDSIVRSVYRNEDGTPMYSSFDDFLIENKFVDKDGNPSTKEYGERMMDYMRAKLEYKEEVESIKGNVR